MTDGAHLVTLSRGDCPTPLALLAAVAGGDDASILEHLDGCPGCRARVTVADRRPSADLDCDGVEALLAEVDDGAALSPEDEASLLRHLRGCDGCRAGVAPLDTSLPTTRRASPGVRLPIVPRSSYQFEEEIARGGMGRILRAVDRRLGRVVAVKEVLPGARANGGHARLEREARITARLSHPAIVSVHEAGVWPHGTPFYAMNLVAGRSLDRVIAEAASFEARLALLPHATAVADALAYAHSEGVVHRDLKPANVIVGKFGETVVIDWGLAKRLGEAERGEASEGGDELSALTQHGATVGTPAYMAPEQAEGHAVDRRADVYALGAMLYHLLAGRPPYVATSAREVLVAVRDHAPRPLVELVPDVPPALASIVAVAMARDPGARFPSAAELADELRRFQTGRLVRAHAYGLVDLVRHWLARRRVSVALAAALAVALVVTGGVGLERVLHERDRAEVEALRAGRVSERLIAARAREVIPRDPTAGVAWLHRLSLRESGREARAILDEAEAAGVARRVLVSHRAAVGHLITSRDGRRAVSGSLDGELRVWDLERGAGRRLGSYGATIHELALSSDGRTLAVAGEAGLQVWDVATGVPWPVPGHRGAVYTVGFTAFDRALVTGGADGTLQETTLAPYTRRVWVGVAGSAPRSTALFSYHVPGPGLTVATTVDGDILAVDGGGRVRWRHPHPAGMPVFAAVSPRGDEVTTVGTDGELRRVRVDDGTVTTLAHAPDVVRLDYAPDGSALAASTRSPTVRLWSLPSGSERAFVGHTLQTYGVTFARDGSTFASSGHDGTVRVWDPTQGELWTLRGHRAPVQWLAAGAGGTLLSISLDGTARFWQPGRRATRVLAGHDGPAYGVAFARDGAVAASWGLDGVLRVWALATLAHKDLAHAKGVWRAWLSPPGDRALTSDGAGVCRLWDLTRGEAVVLGEIGACRERGGFSRDGQRVATLTRDRRLRVWSTTLPSAPVVDEGGVVSFAFTPGGALLRLTADGAVSDGERVVGHTPPPPLATWVAWSTDAGVVAVVDRQAVTAVTLATGRRTVMARPDVGFYGLSVSPDGRTLAIGDWRGRLHLYDAAEGRHTVLAAHTQGVAAVTLGAAWAASASPGELRLTDLAGDRTLALHGHADWVNDLAFSPAGDLLLSACSDGTVRLWSTATPRTDLAHDLEASTTARLDESDELAVQ